MKTKLFTAVLFLLSTTYSIGQKYDIRLEKNHGDTIGTIFSNRHNYYNFLVFELDNSYEIITKAEIPSSQKILKASNFKNSNGKPLTKKEIVAGKFNFKEWGIVLKQDDPIYIELEDKSILHFHPKLSNNIRFASSPLNTK